MKKPYRVVLHESYFHHWAGAQKTGAYLAAGLDREYFDPLIVTAGEGLFAEKARSLGLRVVCHTPPPPLNDFGRTLLHRNDLDKARILFSKVLPYNLKFRSLLREEEADLLVCNTARSTLLLPFIKHLGPCPVVTYLQGAIDLGRMVKSLVRWGSDYYITVSDEIAPVYDLPPAKYSMVPNGLPEGYTEGSFILDSVEKPPGKRWMVAVGNVVPYKGHRELLYSFAEIVRSAPEWDLLVIGSTEENPGWADSLKEEAIRLGIGSIVHWVGWVEDVRPFLAKTDLFVMPSHVEGLPYCLMEAMSFGLPVVVTSVSGVKMLLGEDGEGIIVPPKDKDRLTSGILEALDKIRKYPEFGRANRARIVNRFTRKAMCRKAGNAFLSVMGQGIPA